ncbi:MULTISPECIES: hypothetical protein [unclassified Bradyrhizobium]|uniref:hypothetical protein n=1 Tax=unclassified Bradyrhizobium TaxID=2631580 RepID=UPI00339676C0
MADSKAHKPGGLLDQYNLLGAIIDASWATRLDHKVARHIIDRYYPKHGNGRASLRYLERATGASRPNVIASVRRLAEQGAIVLVRQGQGTRPSEFSLNFEFPSSGIADDTTSTNEPSGSVSDTTGGIAHDTSSASSGTADDTESYLLNPAYKAEIQKDRDGTRPPTAPPHGAGLAATPAGGTAVEELASSQAKPTFELCYRTYDCLKGKKEARAAWDALPAEVDRAAVIRVAAAWQASWAAQGKPDAPRYALARWLKDERYDEDPPKGFQPKERPIRAAKVNSAITSTTAKPAKRAVRTTATTARITSVDVVKTKGATELRLEFTDGDGAVWDYIIPLEHDVQEKQEDGQRLFTRLGRATGLERIDDTAELLGRTVILTGDDAAFAAPATRPDDEPPLPVKPEPVDLHTPSAAPPPRPADFGTKEWERRYTARQERAAGMREWDAAHPEFFEDAPVDDAPPSKRRMTVDEEQAEYDAWFEAQLEDGA